MVKFCVFKFVLLNPLTDNDPLASILFAVKSPADASILPVIWTSPTTRNWNSFVVELFIANLLYE